MSYAPYHDEQPFASQAGYPAQPGMQVAPGGSRNFKGMAIVDGEREWSHDTFDCCADPLTFLASWFLPCIVYGRNRARFQSLETYGTVSTETVDGLIGGDSLMYCAAQCFGCGGLVGMMGRGQTRARYGIAGSGGGDCLLSCCCAPCALTQESREIEQEEQSLGHPGAGLGR
ncbi:PLAC8-domain-containing protein [Mycena filopes]|nr:PLAC8-domain-containing protein [Mycena filopes]KAJ7186028.1 PLAC8-domain-containing protein [Mycena filopes]